MIHQRRTIDQLADEVRHVTAQIPRAIEVHKAKPSKVGSTTDTLLESHRRASYLLKRLNDEIDSMKAALDDISLQYAETGLPTCDVKAMTGIVEAAIESSGYTLTDIRSRSRMTRLVRARHIAILALCAAGYTATEVGRFTGREHGTIYYVQEKAGTR